MSKSPKEVLDDFQANMPKLAKAIPQVTAGQAVEAFKSGKLKPAKYADVEGHGA